MEAFVASTSRVLGAVGQGGVSVGARVGHQSEVEQGRSRARCNRVEEVRVKGTCRIENDGVRRNDAPVLNARANCLEASACDLDRCIAPHDQVYIYIAQELLDRKSVV